MNCLDMYLIEASRQSIHSCSFKEMENKEGFRTHRKDIWIWFSSVLRWFIQSVEKQRQDAEDTRSFWKTAGSKLKVIDKLFLKRNTYSLLQLVNVNI